MSEVTVCNCHPNNNDIDPLSPTDSMPLLYQHCCKPLTIGQINSKILWYQDELCCYSMILVIFSSVRSIWRPLFLTDSHLLKCRYFLGVKILVSKSIIWIFVKRAFHGLFACLFLFCTISNLQPILLRSVVCVFSERHIV